MRSNFAIYRLPEHGLKCSKIECDDDEILFPGSYAEVDKVEGFVVAPFSISSACPLFVLPSDESSETDVRDLYLQSQSADLQILKADEQREAYTEDFAKFHDKTKAENFRKIVLARKSVLTIDKAVDEIRIFHRLCLDYPQSFVSLIKTTFAGTWIMATPEILLESSSKGLHTMALAGTRPCMPDSPEPDSCDALQGWDAKNIKEQQLVADYIMSSLKNCSDAMRVSGPYTIRYGNIEHIRSDFYFRKNSDTRLGNIVSALHPTPAVCGLPSRSALDFILKNEHDDRQYYSGFCGPCYGEDDFHFFVTLRCMKLAGQEIELFAGGGILPDSDEDEEWNETMMKMQAMKHCILG